MAISWLIVLLCENLFGLRIMFVHESTTNVWINVSKEGDKIFKHSEVVLNLYIFNTLNVFKIYALWNLNTTHFMLM